MDIGLSEAVAFVYTLGVLVTGVWAVDPTWDSFTPATILLLGILSVVWTAYFSWTVKSRIVDIETEDEDEEGEAGQIDSPDPGI